MQHTMPYPFQEQHASSTGWGGVVRGPSGSVEVFRAAADFPTEWLHSHINVKETFALHEVLRLLVEARPDFLQGSTVTMDVDNKTMFHSVQKGRAKNDRMDESGLQAILVTGRLRLHTQVTVDTFERELRSRRSDSTRLMGTRATAPVGLQRVMVEWGGFDMDLMASTTSAQRPPALEGMLGQALPFYSRFATEARMELTF